MSIRTFNKIMTSKGCIPVMSLVLLITMVMSFANFRGCGHQNGMNSPDETGPQIIATVGKYEVDAKFIQNQYEGEIQQFPSAPTAKMETEIYGAVLVSQINPGFAIIDAERKHIPITDADIRKAYDDQNETQLQSARMQLMQSGKLKPTATDKEFAAAYKAASGKDLDEIRKQEADDLATVLKDPTRRMQFAGSFAMTLVPKALADRDKPTDAELKDSYRSLDVKQILLNGADVPGQIEKVQADLKKGVSFETAIERYSKDKAPTGKTLADMEAPLSREQLLNDEFAPLRTLKVGDVSPVVTTPNGSVIYKIVKIKDDLPKDFDKNKEALRTQLATDRSKSEFQKDLKELAKTVTIQWNDAGWHALYDYINVTEDMSLKPDEKQTKLKAVLELAKGASQSQPGALAFYSAVSDLKNDLAGKPNPEFEQTQIQAIQAVSEFAPGTDLDLELANIYAAKRDGANLGQALVKAADDNSDFSPAGQGTYLNIQIQARTNAALLSPDAKKAIADAQAQWQKGSDDQKKEQAEAAKAEADAKKQSEIDRKKFESDSKKIQDEQKAAAGKGAAAGPTPPASAPGTKQTPATKP